MLLEIIALLLVAASPEPQADASRRPARDNPDRVICRAQEGVTGSRLARRRVCRTVAEWRAYEVDREQFRRELMNIPAPSAD